MYFPRKGVVSLVSVFESGESAEMATVGREGMVSASAFLGAEQACARQVVQVPGSAFAMELAALRRLAERLPALNSLLTRYACAFLAEALQSVACNSLHSVEGRCARWLLTMHDRSGSDSFALTQEYLAEMLSVSRPTVNLAARRLQRAGLIRYRRGVITLLDRAGLESSACECYRLIRSRYEKYLPHTAAKVL